METKLSLRNLIIEQWTRPSNNSRFRFLFPERLLFNEERNFWKNIMQLIKLDNVLFIIHSIMFWDLLPYHIGKWKMSWSNLIVYYKPLSTLRGRNLKIKQSPVILNLCLRKTRSGKSRDYRDVMWMADLIVKINCGRCAVKLSTLGKFATYVIYVNKLTSVFHASVLLLMMDFVIF